VACLHAIVEFVAAIGRRLCFGNGCHAKRFDGPPRSAGSRRRLFANPGLRHDLGRLTQSHQVVLAALVPGRSPRRRSQSELQRPVIFQPRRSTSLAGYAGSVPSLAARIAAVVATFATAIFLSSCTSPASDDHVHPTRTDRPVVTGEPAGHNAPDVAFADTMIPHHEQGIDMSALVPGRSNNSEAVTFAAKIAAALQSDIAILKVLRVQWDENSDTKKDGPTPGTTTKGMVDNATIAKLDSLHGTDFDALWLHSMISLAQGAIEMADAEVARGKNMDAIGLAKHIVAAQQAEIGQMNQMLEG
jgi:uncharacterized protein (DUF305 family)